MLCAGRQIDEMAASLPAVGRWPLVWFLMANIMVFGAAGSGPFIYFQF